MTDFSYQKQGRSHQWCHSFAYSNVNNFSHRVVGGPFPGTTEWHSTWDPAVGGPVRYVADEISPLGGALPSPLSRPSNTIQRNYSVVAAPRITGDGGLYLYQTEVELPRFGDAVTPYSGAPSPTQVYIPILSWGGYGHVPENLAPSNSELLIIRDAHLLMGHDLQSNRRVFGASGSGTASAYQATSSLPPRVESGAGTVSFELFAATVSHDSNGDLNGLGNPGDLLTSATVSHTQELGNFITNSYKGAQPGIRPLSEFTLVDGSSDKESINAFWSWVPQGESDFIALAPYQCMHGTNLLWTPHVVWLRAKLTSSTAPFILSGGRMRVVLHLTML